MFYPQEGLCRAEPERGPINVTDWLNSPSYIRWLWKWTELQHLLHGVSKLERVYSYICLSSSPGRGTLAKLMMNEWMNEWWWWWWRQKMFRKFLETSFIIRSEIKKNPILVVLRKTFFIGNYFNFNFENREFLG